MKNRVQAILLVMCSLVIATGVIYADLKKGYYAQAELGSIRQAADRFRSQAAGAHILLKEVQDAERFGVAEVSGSRIVGIEEKPSQPKSNYAVTGIYMYDASVFDKIKTLVPSRRNELEITDVNNAYIAEGNLSFSYLDGWWTDAGTFDSLLLPLLDIERSTGEILKGAVFDRPAIRGASFKELSFEAK